MTNPPRLPEAVPQPPSCGACYGDTEHDGDQWACYDCQLTFDETTMEAEFLTDAEPCAAPCTNWHHGPNRIWPGFTFDCHPCALPAGHGDGHPNAMHWHGCTKKRITETESTPT